MNKKILFGAAYSVIEPLGLLHLAGLARDLGWERKFVLVKDHDFEPLFERVKEFKPDVVGFNIYTGNHLQTFEAFKKIKKDNPGTQLVLGGPHATYFPVDAATQSDYVVMSEGFKSLETILTGNPKPGIFPLTHKQDFPLPDRETFYADYPAHARSAIKSMITMTGCPYTCTYCYNSSKPEDIKDGLPAEVFAQMAESKGMGGRLFPNNVRSVDSVIRECRELVERWPETKVIYSQDDVHGFDVKPGGWMEQFAKRWKKEVGVPYHAQLRWEMVNPFTEGKRRLDLMQEAGCFGLTLAIEAADHTVRQEILDRAMPESLMFNGMSEIISRGLRVRTEQITGLPYGATTKQTKMNLDADLELVELNVRLLEQTGGPTMAWASTLAPYKRTKIGTYCEINGHYHGQNEDVPDTFFDRSVLRFPQEWVGPRLKDIKNDEGVWLSQEGLERYRNQNVELRNIFNFVARIPDGHVLAKSYLTSSHPFTFARLGRETEEHLAASKKPAAAAMLESINTFRDSLAAITNVPVEQVTLSELAPFFGSLPFSDIAARKFVSDSREKGGMTSKVLSTAVRHHLYDNVLYATGPIVRESEKDFLTSRQSSYKV